MRTFRGEAGEMQREHAVHNVQSQRPALRVQLEAKAGTQGEQSRRLYEPKGFTPR